MKRIYNRNQSPCCLETTHSEGRGCWLECTCLSNIICLTLVLCPQPKNASSSLLSDSKDNPFLPMWSLFHCSLKIAYSLWTHIHNRYMPLWVQTLQASYTLASFSASHTLVSSSKNSWRRKSALQAIFNSHHTV